MTARTRLFALAFGALFAACSPAPEQAGSESHFLQVCSDSCPAGLECLCGVCTTACDSAAACAAYGAQSACVTAQARGSASVCETMTGGVCDVSCAAASDCAALGPAFFCEAGFCRVDPQYRTGEPMPGFGALCEQSGLMCSTVQAPPSLVGNYTGQGTVVLSSNALWAVGASETVSVQITQQSNGTLAGSIELQSLSLSADGAAVRGEGSAFTLYATGPALVSGCTAEARALVSGTLDESVTPATVTGELGLRFTGNFASTGCTADQLGSYPATGANFKHSETRLP